MLQMKKNPRSQMAHSNAFSVVDPPDKRHRKLVGSENFESESDVGSLMSGACLKRAKYPIAADFLLLEEDEI